MKKNISINISGIIFHIEEDGYDRLKAYLDSITKYFSSFDESQEIIADIESRIAEIFLSKLNENKQVITAEDVEALVATMGSIQDFQAIEESFDPEEKSSSSSSSQEEYGQFGKSRKLYRDEKRKLLGGVCAGIAHYFNLDPLWIRLLFLILFLGSYGTLIIVYIVLWVVVPSSYDLEEDQKMKKMFRDPGGKVIGGVASGVATYFGVEVAVIRLLFVIFAFFGAGIILYIILWIILPEAKTITDKVQMQGEPVTLSNIESNVKKSLNVNENEEENIFVKILLFPFRLISTLISGLGKALGPLALFIVDFIRIIVGIVMTITGLSLMFSALVILGVFLGLITKDSALFFGITNLESAIPMDIFLNSFPVFTGISAFLALLIPSILIVLLGISMIVKKIIFSATVGWSLFALFIISGVILAINGTSIAVNFDEHGEYKVTESYEIEGETVVLKLNEVGMEEYDGVHLRIRGHELPEFKLVQEFEARGHSRKNAVENAKMVDYGVVVKDSIITFDSNIIFQDDAIFRAQSLVATLYVPYDREFTMEDGLRYIIWNTLWRSGYRARDIEGNVWYIDEDDNLICKTCNATSRSRYGRNEASNSREYAVSGFTDIEIESPVQVYVNKSQRFMVRLSGPDRYLNEYTITQDEDKIIVAYTDGRQRRSTRTNEAVKVHIAMPTIDGIELNNASKLKLYRGFNLDDFNIDMSDFSSASLDIKCDNLEVDLSGNAQLELEGKGNEMQVQLSGESQLDAYDFSTYNTTVRSKGTSVAKVYVTDNIEIDASFAGSVKYKGGAKVVRNVNDSED
ncbi:MAG: PspC domain-containing protein [Bacteroidota bacterium]